MKARLLLIFIALLSISACALQTPTEGPAVYVLQAAVSPNRVAQDNGKILLIAQIRAEAGFDSRRMIYTETPSALSYYARSEWADEPAKLITPIVAETLNKTGVYKAVLTQPTAVNVDQRLDLELIRLQQNFLVTPSQLHLTLRASLSNARDNTLIASKLFDVRQAAPSENAYGGVQAANSALSSVMTQLLRWMVDLAV